MTSLKRRLGRTSVFLLVGALTLLPITASAAPTPSQGSSIDAYGNENSNSGGNENSNSGGNENSNSGGNNGNVIAGEGNNGQGNGNGGPPSITPSGVTPNQGLPASITPSGIVPTEGGLGSVNAQQLPTPLGAAIVLFYQQDDERAPFLATVEAPPTPTPLVSGSVIRVLGPMISPALASVVAAPIVVVEALIEAMAAAGQAVVIPFIAGAVALVSPGLRRRNLLDAALGRPSENSDDS